MSDEKPGREENAPAPDDELTDEQIDAETPGVDDAAELEAAEAEVADEAEADEDKVVATPARRRAAASPPTTTHRRRVGRPDRAGPPGRRRPAGRRGHRHPVPRRRRAGPRRRVRQEALAAPVPPRGRRRAAQGHLARPAGADHLHDRGDRLRRRSWSRWWPVSTSSSPRACSPSSADLRPLRTAPTPEQGREPCDRPPRALRDRQRRPGHRPGRRAVRRARQRRPRDGRRRDRVRRGLQRHRRPGHDARRARPATRSPT